VSGAEPPARGRVRVSGDIVLVNPYSTPD
jgi:hypothetical protein